MVLAFENVFDASANEQNGRVESLRRQGRVTGLSSSSPQGYSSEIYGDSTGVIPQSGQIITVNGNQLVLTGREILIDDESAQGGAILTLTYERSSSDSGEVRRFGRSSLRQILTPVDRDGNPIQVTFQGATQEGSLSVFVPQSQPVIETIESTNNPDSLVAEWIGHVNSTAWRGAAPGQWIVATVDYDEFDTSSLQPRYRFRFGFQRAESSEGWLPFIAFTDDATGRRAEGTTIGDGIQPVPYYPERNFNTRFP